MFEWGVRSPNSSIICAVVHRPLFVFYPFFYWSLHCLSFLGLRLLIIIVGLFKLFLYHPPIYNNIVILLYTNMTYLKRQYDIKQSIGNGIRIKLSSTPPKVNTTSRYKSWIETTVDTHTKIERTKNRTIQAQTYIDFDPRAFGWEFDIFMYT